VEIKQAVQSGLPTLAVDVPMPAFEAMAKNANWTRDDDYEAWKSVLANFPAQQTGYANQIKDAIVKRREEGSKFMLLFAVRGERVCLLALL
jgi:translation initiation factor 2-alpha kinase 4